MKRRLFLKSVLVGLGCLVTGYVPKGAGATSALPIPQNVPKIPNWRGRILAHAPPFYVPRRAPPVESGTPMMEGVNVTERFRFVTTDELQGQHNRVIQELLNQEAGMNKPTILVDFDGVIHSYTSGWKGVDQIPDEPVEGALEWLQQLVDTDKFTVCIYSSRSKEEAGLAAMSAWIEHWQGIKELPLTEYWMPITKPAAFLTLDDRAITFQGPGTFPQPEEILAFKPWNKRPPQAHA